MATSAKKKRAPAKPKGKSKTVKKSKAALEQERRLEIIDPRQRLAWTAYADPASPTFGNLKRSCINAGYSEQYADNITNLMPEWLSGFMGEDSSKLAKVERNLHKFLDLETQDHLIGPNGPLYEDKNKTKPKMVENPRKLDIQLKATTFVAERLNRKKYGKDDKVNIGFQFNIAPIRKQYEA